MPFMTVCHARGFQLPAFMIAAILHYAISYFRLRHFLSFIADIFHYFIFDFFAAATMPFSFHYAIAIYAEAFAFIIADY
jgi:hypothetical protein